jgi:hypothetical protein
MSRWLIRAALAVLLLAIVVAVALTAAWLSLPLEGTTISVDGDSFSLASLRGDHVVAAFAIALVVALVASIVAAAVLAFTLVVVLLATGVALLVTVASLAIVASPLLFVGWLVWRATRPPRPRAAVAA